MERIPKLPAAVLAALLLMSLAFACAAPTQTPAPSPAPAPAPTQTAAPKPALVPSPSPAPAPAPSAKFIEIKGVLYKMPATQEALMGRAFLTEIEKRSNGLLKFKLLGGDEVIPSLEQHEAVRKGVVDFSWTPASYGAGLVPEVNAHTLLRFNNKGERERGIYKFLNEIYQKQNLYYVTNLDPSNWEQNFLFVINKPIEKPEDMKGMRMRATATHLPLVQTFGAIPINMPQPDMYTAVERGMINGGVSTISTFFDFSLNEVLKYYVLPGFGHSQVIFYMNLDTWKKIPADLQKLITDTLIDLEPKYAAEFTADYESRVARMDKAGIKRIQLSPQDGERLVAGYYDGNWKSILKVSPANGARLRELAGLPPLK